MGLVWYVVSCFVMCGVCMSVVVGQGLVRCSCGNRYLVMFMDDGSVKISKKKGKDMVSR